MSGPALSTPPRLSLAERDRRWDLVRQAMERERVDCLITPGNPGQGGALQAESRYLAGQADGSELTCVFPGQGQATLVTTSPQRRPDEQDWIADVRATEAPGAAAAAVLGEHSLPHRRVAIVGLSHHPGASDGTASHGLIAALSGAFPDVELVDFTDQMQAIRMPKSPAEIALLERSAALAERGVQRVAELACTGASEHAVWAAMLAEICRGGSELPSQTEWGSGVRPTLLTRPTHGRLHRGHLLVSLVDAAYAGYHALALQAFAVEECDVVYRDLYRLHADFWEACFAELKVGRTLGDLAERCRALGAAVLPDGSRYAKPTGELVLRGCGLGADEPLLRAGRVDAAAPDLVLAPGWAFLFEPSLSVEAGNRRYSVAWGDTVVMDEAGPRRLGKRPAGLIVSAAPTAC